MLLSVSNVCGWFISNAHTCSCTGLGHSCNSLTALTLTNKHDGHHMPTSCDSDTAADHAVRRNSPAIELSQLQQRIINLHLSTVNSNSQSTAASRLDSAAGSLEPSTPARSSLSRQNVIVISRQLLQSCSVRLTCHDRLIVQSSSHVSLSKP